MTASHGIPSLSVRSTLAEAATVEVVTQHAKEKTLSLPFAWGLGVGLVASQGIDTDELGTFCGSRERLDTPFRTLLAKLALGRGRWRLASEGSFGPHPEIGFVPCHHEILALRDEERDLTWHEAAMTLDTNYLHRFCHDWTEVEALAKRAGFPGNALMVLGPDPHKGIQDWGVLERCWRTSGPCLVQTDMRNHLNQPRRYHLRRLGLKLVRRMRSLCPECSCPGFGTTRVEKGLPCEWCGLPTSWVAREIWTCQACGFQDGRARCDGLTRCDPRHCDVCNP